MRIGSEVIIKETGQHGVVIGINDTMVHVQTGDKIIKVTRDAIIVVTLLHELWGLVKSLFKSIKETFKKK